MANSSEDLNGFMEGVRKRSPGETEFHQAVQEVAATILPYIADKPIYKEAMILERMTEPDRTISFRVTWQDDAGNVRVNRGYRVQFNNSIGPYKGGIRFHPSVTQSVLKFLGFEQTFKNSLTQLPMGGGKGGADFNPKGKSEAEIMRFCQAFMTELSKYVGPDIDVPAGDIGVGGREIGFMFGQYKRMTNRFNGVLTGKGREFGGSLLRPEATGYGAVYMLEDMLHTKGNEIDGKRAVISGSGNVATHAAEKIIHRGGTVLTLSDSGGFIYDKDGITLERLQWIKDLKEKRRGRIEEYATEFGAEFHAETRPWNIPCDVALPCATQNEINADEAAALIKNGCMAVSEGANMPTTIDGINNYLEAKILYAPSKAANAGGVATSGLEMSQNAAHISWKEEELSKLLRDIMHNIHAACVEYGDQGGGYVDYMKGANIAGFRKVADAMLAFGAI